jgi:hypothetical protein
MAGWAGSDPAEGRTPEAECQWWADRLEGGSADAARLFYSPEAESSGERFRPWGAARLQRNSRRRRIPALLPKEGCRVLAYRHVPPCGKGSSINPAGSGAQGAADRPYPPRRPPRTAPPAGAGWGGTGGWRRSQEEDTGGGAGPRPPHLAAAAAGLLQLCACSGRRRAAAGAAAPAVGRWEDWQAGRERKVAS